MVLKIFESFLSLIGGLLQGWVNSILGYLTLDLGVIRIALPGLETLKDIMLALGIAIVVVCILVEVFQYVSMPFTGQERKGLLQASFRIAVSAGGVLLIYPICATVLSGLVNPIYLAIMGESEKQTVKTNILDEFSEIDTLGEALEGNSGFAEIFGLIIAVLILFQFFKLTLSMLTRYVTFALGVYLSPLCMGFGASETTSQITSAWLRTVASQVILFMVTAWSLNVMYASMQNYSAADTTVTYIVKYMVIYVFGKVILKLDEFLNRLGFNTMPSMQTARSGLMGIAALGSRAVQGLSKGSGTGGSAGKGSSVATGSSRPPVLNKDNNMLNGEKMTEGMGKKAKAARLESIENVNASMSTPGKAVPASQVERAYGEENLNGTPVGTWHGDGQSAVYGMMDVPNKDGSFSGGEMHAIVNGYNNLYSGTNANGTNTDIEEGNGGQPRVFDIGGRQYTPDYSNIRQVGGEGSQCYDVRLKEVAQDLGSQPQASGYPGPYRQDPQPAPQPAPQPGVPPAQPGNGPGSGKADK